MNNLTKNIILFPFNILYRISPKASLKVLFRIKQGYKLDLENPTTYNEKLQWIKLYDKNPLMPICCDKYAVRSYVESKGCGEILNELYWEGSDPEGIPFDELPEKFVVKVTHGSTFNIICTDKDTLDRNQVVEKCKKWLKAKFLPCYGEWFYGVEKPRVIVEKFIESTDDAQLRDYKVFCFNGIPKAICVDTDRFTKHKRDLYDTDWNRIEDGNMGFPESKRNFEKPGCLNELLLYARKLSAPFLHARVDFYITNDKIYFGEITFTNGAGFDKFSNYDFDKRLGSYLKLKL